MRYPLSVPARTLASFSEHFPSIFDLDGMVKLFKCRVGPLLLCCSALLLGMAVANAQWQLQRLYTAPNASEQPTFLVQGNDGNFYGTMASAGYVFKMTPSGIVTIIPTFLLGLNRELAKGDDGNIYGSVDRPTFGGNTNGYIFKITPAGQVIATFVFDGTNGAHPNGMRKGIDGCFYGVMGASNTIRFTFPPTNHASIFQFTTNNTVTKLYSVTNGADFTGLPVQGTDGYLYGTSFSDSGLVMPPFVSPYHLHFYRLSTNGDFQTIYTRSNASAPAGDLIFGPDGALYGTISSDIRVFSGTFKSGSIFRLTTDGVFSNLFSFSSSNGLDPEARLLSANDGFLYGSTYGGGVSNRGTLFRISTAGEFASIFNFTGANGGNPTAPLVQGIDGNLYGVTGSSIVTNIGTIYRLVQPTAISSFAVSSGTATLTWNSFSNAIYRVEYKSALTDPSWTPLVQSVTATDQTITVVDTQATDPQRLYRVVLLP